MKLKCVIIDDEPIARKVLQEFIEDINYLELIGETGQIDQGIPEQTDHLLRAKLTTLFRSKLTTP